jgi:hypothetical protein
MFFLSNMTHKLVVVMFKDGHDVLGLRNKHNFPGMFSVCVPCLLKL